MIDTCNDCTALVNCDLCTVRLLQEDYERKKNLILKQNRSKARIKRLIKRGEVQTCLDFIAPSYIFRHKKLIKFNVALFEELKRHKLI